MRRGRETSASALCGIGGLALVTSMFVRWYPDHNAVYPAYFDRSVGDPAVAVGARPEGDAWLNAWEAFSVLDIVLAVVALVAVAAAVALLRGTAVRGAAAGAAGAGGVALALIVYRAIETPAWVWIGRSVGVGALLAACAALTIVFGGALTLGAGRTAAPRAS